MDALFLTLDEVREIHEQQIERYGGSHGVRDTGALESALAMPLATFDGEYLHPTIVAMAAAYLFPSRKTIHLSTETSARERMRQSLS